jgi:hypothetical protein
MDVFLSDLVDATQPRDEEAVRSRLLVVYDGGTGDVMHVHRCVGDARFVADEAHARTAMQLAGTAGEIRDLRVLLVPNELDVQGDVALHVDLSSGQVVVTKAECSSVAPLEGHTTKYRRKE